MSIEDVFGHSKIDPWFLHQIKNIIDLEKDLLGTSLKDLSKENLFHLKQKGFSDRRLATLLKVKQEDIRHYRHKHDVRPVYKRVDTCAAEFSTNTAYMYSTYEEECEAKPTDRKKIIEEEPKQSFETKVEFKKFTNYSSEQDNIGDVDPQETIEWIDSLNSVVERDGPKRANYLLGKLINQAYISGSNLPYNQKTPYINTIPREMEVKSPGDQVIENKIRSLIRWNAACMVVRANKNAEGIGGHLSTFASSASLYEIGFNHFFKGKDSGSPGDQARNSIGASRWTTTGRHNRRPAASSASRRRSARGAEKSRQNNRIRKAACKPPMRAWSRRNSSRPKRSATRTIFSNRIRTIRGL